MPLYTMFTAFYSGETEDKFEVNTQVLRIKFLQITGGTGIVTIKD